MSWIRNFLTFINVDLKHGYNNQNICGGRLIAIQWLYGGKTPLSTSNCEKYKCRIYAYSLFS